MAEARENKEKAGTAAEVEQRERRWVCQDLVLVDGILEGVQDEHADNGSPTQCVERDQATRGGVGRGGAGRGHATST